MVPSTIQKCCPACGKQFIHNESWTTGRTAHALNRLTEHREITRHKWLRLE